MNNYELASKRFTEDFYRVLNKILPENNANKSLYTDDEESEWTIEYKEDNKEDGPSYDEWKLYNE